MMATRYLRLKLQDSRYRYSTSCIPHHKLFLLLTISFLFFFVSWAYAGVPTDQMRSTINSVLNILKNQELEKPEKTKGKRETIRKIIGDRFDFKEMTKRSLALHWRGRSEEERKEFVALFSNLLERTYIDKIETYENESILYIDEMIDGKYAVVRTKVINKKNVEIPIDYKLIKKVDTWLVYDIVIEGVSLVNNYRTQFNKIIRTSSYEKLVERLKGKQKG
jgi:phospholipid transport system substrate-binding protein